MSTPLVSICVPNLNTRPYLQPRMESILNQTNSDWEVVIFDNYSDDGSWEYFQEYRREPRIRLYQAPKEGMYANWNNCVREARGKYIHIATSDDVEDPRFQENLLNLLESNPDCPLAYCEFREIDSEGARFPDLPYLRNYLYESLPEGPERRPWEGEFLHAIALWPPWITMNAVLYRRELMEKTGPFPQHMRSMGDMLWGCRACLEGDLLFSPEIHALWRRHETQASPLNLPDPDDPTNSFMLVEEAQRCLSENLHRLPSHWMKIPHWRQHLQEFRYKDVRAKTGFDRGTLRRRPKRFARAALWFLKNQPDYFFSQMLSGLPYRKDIFDTWLGFRESLATKPALFDMPAPTPLSPSATTLEAVR